MQDSDKTILGKLETIKHIQEVRANLYRMIEELDKRAREHDLSKLESPEAEIFGEYTPELAKTIYGSAEYTALLEKVKPATDNHYAKNRHHPQHFVGGINDMDLVDICELLMDWLAATRRMANGNIRKSIDHNAERFNISEQLTQIFHNTINRYF